MSTIGFISIYMHCTYRYNVANSIYISQRNRTPHHEFIKITDIPHRAHNKWVLFQKRVPVVFLGKASNVMQLPKIIDL